MKGQLNVRDCIDQSILEDCTCSMKDVVPVVRAEAHAPDCPVSLRASDQGSDRPHKHGHREAREVVSNRASNLGKPLSAKDVVNRKLRGG